MTFVPWSQMYDERTCFHLFEFDSGFSGSDDAVNKGAVDSGGMDADVEGSGFA